MEIIKVLFTNTKEKTKEKKFRKGVKRCVINNKLSFNDYKNVLESKNNQPEI